MNSLDSKFHETVTKYQQVEALSNAIAILGQRRDLLAHMPQRTCRTH